MLVDMNAIYILMGAGALYTIGDLVLGHWARGNNFAYLVAGLAINFIGIVAYALTLRFESIGVATAVLLGLNIFAVTVASAVVFSEALPIARMIGIGIIVTGIIFVEVIV